MVKPEVLEAFKEFDSPTIFNAIVLKCGLPNEEYTDHRIHYLLPELGPVIGYAVTAEVTTNDPDSVAVPWDGYYEAIDAMEGPVFAVMKDVDSRPGRGASFGDGMARLHQRPRRGGGRCRWNSARFGGNPPGRVADLRLGDGARTRRIQRDAGQRAHYRRVSADSTGRPDLWRWRRLRAHSPRARRGSARIGSRSAGQGGQDFCTVRFRRLFP